MISLRTLTTYLRDQISDRDTELTITRAYCRVFVVSSALG